MTLMVGDTLLGYCRGHFGRDSYEPKRVEAVGTDWVVARTIDQIRGEHEVLFASGENVHRDLWKACPRNPECEEDPNDV